MKTNPIHSNNSTPPQRRAFTLVELLLVLAILAVLAALIYPRITGRIDGARVTAAVTQIALFGTALEVFEVDNGSFPRTQNGLVDLLQRPRDAANWHGPYVEVIPMDPWGHAYTYAYPGKIHPASYDIISAGPDGTPGTPDDIMNLRPQK